MTIPHDLDLQAASYLLRQYEVRGTILPEPRITREVVMYHGQGVRVSSDHRDMVIVPGGLHVSSFWVGSLATTLAHARFLFERACHAERQHDREKGERDLLHDPFGTY